MNALPPPAVTEVRTLADIIDRLDANGLVDPVRRRDLVSAVRRVAKWLDRPAEQVPVDPRGLARELDRLHPRTLGVSPKTLANVRAGLSAALALAREGTVKRRRLDGDWQALRDALPREGGSRSRLSRFIGWCSAQGINPAAVDDGAAARFRDWLDQCVGVADPAKTFRTTVASWNRAVREVPGWPTTPLTLPPHRKPRFRVRPQELAPSLAAEIDAYIAWRSGADPLDDSAPTKPWRPHTQVRVRADLELLLACWRARGHDLGHLRSLADVVRPDTVKEMLRHRLERTGGKPDSTMRHCIVTLIAIARHWVKAEAETVEGLRRIQRKLGSAPSGMTEKNRRTLGQFEDPANVRALLALPEALLAEADRMAARGEDRGRAALLAQKGCAIAILLGIPMRLANLTALIWHRHLIEPAGRDGPLLLDVPGELTKTGEPVCVQLPDWVAGLVRRYVREHLPRLCSGPRRHLFPGQDGAKTGNGLSGQIRDIIRKRLGLALTPHQFRHLAAKLMLDADPGSFEAVRRLLGHRSLKITTRAYAALDTARAASVYDQVLARCRQSTENTDAPF